MANWLNSLTLGISLSAVAFAGGLQAATPLTVQIDQSQLLTLDTDPGTIIVGNPSIADVSLNGRQLFIHGHSFGATNLMIFDAAGKKMSEFELTVGNSASTQLTVYNGSSANGVARRTYSCAPTCEAAIMIGDPNDFVDHLIGTTRGKADLANGVKTSDLAPRTAVIASPPN